MNVKEIAIPYSKVNSVHNFILKKNSKGKKKVFFNYSRGHT